MMKWLTSQALLFSSCFLYGPHAFNKLADFVYLHGLSYWGRSVIRVSDKNENY